jgi:hypothetical protein
MESCIEIGERSGNSDRSVAIGFGNLKVSSNVVKSVWGLVEMHAKLE